MQKQSERSTTNSINLGVLSIFAVAPFVGYVSQTYLHKGFSTIAMPLLILAVSLMLFLRKQLVFTKPLIALFLFALYTIISDGLISHKEFNTSYFISNELLASVLVFFAIDNTRFDDQYMKYVFNISVVILFIAFIVSVIQQFKDITFFVSPSEVKSLKFLPPWETRLPSIYTWLGPLWILSHCFFPVLSVVIGHLLKHKSKYVWSLFVIGGLVAFFSKSRFILLNFLILFLLIPIYRKVEWKTIIRFFIIIGCSITVFLMLAKQLNFNIDNIIEKRILESDKGGMTKGAAGTRLLAFDIFGKLFVENPLFGKGKLHDFSSNSKDQELVRALAGRSSQIHVGYLSVLYYYGITGGLLFIAFLFVNAKALFHSSQIHHYWGPFFGFTQLILTNLTGVCLHVFIMGYILCFMFDKYYSYQTELHHES